MNNSLYQNGLSYLLNNGLSEDKAISILRQADKELSSLPISSNFESVFYTHLSLCLDIERYKVKKGIENIPTFSHRKKGKPILTLISEPHDTVKVFAVSYEDRR